MCKCPGVGGSSVARDETEARSLKENKIRDDLKW